MLGELAGAAPVVVDGAGHEVYLSDPTVLTALVGASQPDGARSGT